MENYAGSQPACPPLRSQESNFPKKLSKTKSACFGSAALLAPRAGQASAFRGRVGPPSPYPRSTAPRMLCGRVSRALTALSRFPRPHRLGSPRRSNPMGETEFFRDVWSVTPPGAPGAPGAAARPHPRSPPPPPSPSPSRGCPGRRRPAAALAKTRDEKVEGLMFSDRYK